MLAVLWKIAFTAERSVGSPAQKRTGTASKMRPKLYIVSFGKVKPSTISGIIHAIMGIVKAQATSILKRALPISSRDLSTSSSDITP